MVFRSVGTKFAADRGETMGGGADHQYNQCCPMFPRLPVTLCFIYDFGVTKAKAPVPGHIPEARSMIIAE